MLLPICCHQISQGLGQCGTSLVLEMVYRLSKWAIKVYCGTYALNLQGRGLATGAKIIRCGSISTLDAKGRLNAGNLI